MKNILKIIGLLVASYLVTVIIENLFLVNILMHISTTILAGYVSTFIIFVIIFSLFWVIFLRDKSIQNSFFQQIRFKKTYLIIIVIIATYYSFSFVGRVNQYKEAHSLDSDSHFINDDTYENSKYSFKFVYPKGSVFANANPKSGFITRFFISDGELIGGDRENVGIYVRENSEKLETVVQQMKDSYSKYGPIDIMEVKFGGQKGYRIIFFSDYSAPKGTQELTYVTVKNNIEYDLNYFPVAKNIYIVDDIASSFEFTK